MKFTTIAAALLGAAVATEVELATDAEMTAEAEVDAAAEIETQMKASASADAEKDDGDDSHLAQLITSALAGAPPGEITEPTSSANDKENAKQITKGKTPNYEFHWKYACAFTKWTPTNQFLHAGKKYDAATMTLERFGFIGEEKKCYWGMVGVFWVTPLKVVQIKPK